MAYCAHSSIAALLRGYRAHALGAAMHRIGIEFYPQSLAKDAKIMEAADQIDAYLVKIDELVKQLCGVGSQACLLAILALADASDCVGGNLKKLDPDRYSRRTSNKYMSLVFYCLDQRIVDLVRADDCVYTDYVEYLFAIADWYLSVLKTIKVWINT